MNRNFVTAYPGHIDLPDHGQMATSRAVMIETFERVTPAFR